MIFLSLCVFLPVLTTNALLVNRTIDDTYGDSATGLHPVTYHPQDAWNVGSTCRTCDFYPGNLGFKQAAGGIAAAAVDVTKPYNATWHDSTYQPSAPNSTITVEFVGQAIYVFNILANTVKAKSITTSTHLVFTLDGAVVGQYTHTPDPTGPQLLYDMPVYVNPGMVHDKHTLIISAGGSEKSLFLFDYITYTADVPDASLSAVATSLSATRTGLGTDVPPGEASSAPPNQHNDQVTTSQTSFSSHLPTSKHQLTQPLSTFSCLTRLRPSCEYFPSTPSRSSLVPRIHWRSCRGFSTRRPPRCRSHSSFPPGSASAQGHAQASTNSRSLLVPHR